MVAAVETLAYVKDRGVPWHGLGTPADGLMTAAEVLEKAGLDWVVEPRPIFIAGPDGEPQPIESHRAMVRVTDNSVLGVVGRRFTPVQIVETMSVLDDLVDDGGGKYDTAGSLWDGKRVFVSMELPKHIKVRGDSSDYLSYILAINGHDGGQAFEIIRTTVRAVCNNTVEAAKSSALARYTARHTPGVTLRVGEIREALALTFAELETTEQLLNSLTRVKVSETRAKEVLLKVFPLKEAGTAEADLAASDFAAALNNWHSTETLDDKLRGTAFGLYQAIIEYADFGLNYRKADNRAADLMTNSGRPGNIKKAALALLRS